MPEAWRGHGKLGENMRSRFSLRRPGLSAKHTHGGKRRQVESAEFHAVAGKARDDGEKMASDRRREQDSLARGRPCDSWRRTAIYRDQWRVRKPRR